MEQRAALEEYHWTRIDHQMANVANFWRGF
jgi:hypothetical protein